jgi:hypothetical protein
MTEKPEASVLTARRAAQHFRLSSADDAYEHLYILTTIKPRPVSTSCWQIHRGLAVSAPLLRAWIHCPRAPERFVTSPLCLVGYVRWDARSDRVPPLQTIIFSSFTGRTPVIRLTRWHWGIDGRYLPVAASQMRIPANTAASAIRLTAQSSQLMMGSPLEAP